MYKFLKLNPNLGLFLIFQLLMQLRVATNFLQFNGLLESGLLALALALAHVIPTYMVYVVGGGLGLVRAPGLKSKVVFALVGMVLATIVSLTFTYCALGILCLPFLPLVVNPTITSIGAAGLFGAIYGSLIDVVAVFAVLAHSDAADK